MAQSQNLSSEDLNELVEKLLPRLVAAIQAATPSTAQNAPQTNEPVVIPRPPDTAPVNRSTATCKPPKEPSLAGDKAQEWLEFEREFLRYFRITQSYYLEPEVQVDLLLATAGEKVRRIFYQLRLPEADSKNLEAVIRALRQVFAQQQSPFVNSYLFMKIRRESGEDLDNFVARLREAAKKCAFADEDRRVLEQLVFSTIDNVDVLKRIIKESPPTLNEMIRILKTDEAAMREMDRMVNNQAVVNAIKQPRRERQSQQQQQQQQRPASRPQREGDCGNCIFAHSKEDSCPAKSMECFYCGKVGHMIRKCRKRASTNGNQPQNFVKRKKVNVVEEESDPDDSDSEAAIDSVFIASLDTGTDDRSWQTAIRIAGKKVNCKIDTDPKADEAQPLPTEQEGMALPAIRPVESLPEPVQHQARTDESAPPATQSPAPALRRSTRARRAPERYSP